MNFLKRLFGSSDPLTELRRYADQGRWADLLSRAGDFSGDEFDAAGREEVDDLVRRAGDRLAEVNIAESEACLRAGDPPRARDHLDLAADQARAPALLERVRALRQEVDAPPGAGPESAEPVEPEPAAGADCGGGCGDHCGPAVAAGSEPDSAADLDLETRLELSLGGYPEDLVERYRQAPEPFQEAVILAHRGDDAAALAALDAPACSEAQDLFFYERGTLQARMGRVEEGIADLEQTLELAPAHPLAGDVLLSLLFADRRLDEAEKLVDRLAAAGQPAALLAARRATLEALRGHPQAALEHGRQAFREGNRETELVLLVAGLAEREGALEEAESLLAGLSGGGCGDSVPVPLAEFWLRHGRQLDRALETFKAAWRHDPGNPLWPLRTARTYLARGWQGEGRKLLLQVLEMDGLPDGLRREARELLDGS